MKFTMQIDVTGTQALLTEMPKLSEGATGLVELAVTFDPSWSETAPRRAVLWRENDVLLQIELNEDGKAPVPSAFTESEEPFYVRITGREDGALSTNELCASFFDLYSAEATEPRYKVHGGTYALTQNGTYFGENTLLTQPVHVAVPYNADTTADTVTAETLHAGVTAHDAKGDAITGTYVNPYNADTTADTVTAETLHAGITAHDAKGGAITGTYVNPYNANTTADTVTAEKLHAGVTAHDAKGGAITGTYVNPYNANTTADTVTAETLHAGITAHDAKGNAITGNYTPTAGHVEQVRVAAVTNRITSVQTCSTSLTVKT